MNQIEAPRPGGRPAPVSPRPRDRSPGQTVGSVMTREVTSLAPQQSLRSAVTSLRSQRVSGCPVVDATGTVVGVLSESDVVRALQQSWMEARPLALLDLLLAEGPLSRPEIIDDLRSRLERLTVADAMTTSPALIEDTQTLDVAARIMKERSVNRLPVLHQGKLVGVIGRRDLIMAWPSASP